MKDYANILELVRTRGWAIMPEVLATIRTLVAGRIAGEHLSDQEIRARVATAQAQYGERTGDQRAAGVAVIPLYGPIIPKASLMSDMSGATSVQAFMRAFRSAVADPEVKAIVLDVDSPGGMTDLITEAAAEIYAARSAKPIVSVANTAMASAAYWLGSAAEEIVATPSAIVGAIGVFTWHEDLSGSYALAGVGREYVGAGRYKLEATDLEPLSDEARRHIQAIVDEDYGRFVADVAKHRGVKPDQVRNGYGEGRAYTSNMARAAGMIDRVDTLDATVKRMIWVAQRRPSAQSASLALDPSELRAALDAGTISLNLAQAWLGADLATLELPDDTAETVEAEVVEVLDISVEVEVETPEAPDQPAGQDPAFAFERELRERRRLTA